MKMAYEFNDLKGFLFLVLIAMPKTLSTNIDCGGKPFHCLNSTHFMICVDLGGGVSSTIDDFIIPCPPTTVCQKDNRYECEFPKIKESTTPLFIVGISTIPPDKASTVLSATEKNIAPVMTVIGAVGEPKSSNNNEIIVDSLKEEFTVGNKMLSEENVAPLMNTVTESQSMIEIGLVSPIEEIFATTDDYLLIKLESDTSNDKTAKALQENEGHTTPLYATGFYKEKNKNVPPQTLNGIMPQDKMDKVQSVIGTNVATTLATVHKTTRNASTKALNSLTEEFPGENKKLVEYPLRNTVTLSPNVKEMHLVSPKIEEMVTITNKYATATTKSKAETFTESVVEDFSKNENSTTFNVSPQIDVSISTIPPYETTAMQSSTEKYITTVKQTTQKTMSTLNNDLLESLQEEFTGGDGKIIKENISPLTNTVNSSHTVNETGIASPKIDETVTITNKYVHTKLRTDSLTSNLMEGSPKIKDTTTPVYDYSFSGQKEETIPTPIEVRISTIPSDETTIVLSSTDKYITTVKPTIHKTTSTLSNEILESLKEEFTGGNEKIFKESVSPLMNTVNSSHTVNKTGIPNPKIDETVTISNEYIHTELKTDISTSNLIEIFPEIKDTIAPVYDYSFSGLKEETIPTPIEVSISTIPSDETTTVLSSTEKHITTVKPSTQKTASTLNHEVLESLKEEFTGGNEKIFKGNVSTLTNTVNSSHTVNETGIASPKADKTVTITHEYVHTKLKTDSVTNNLMVVSPKIIGTPTPVYDYSFSGSKEETILPLIEVNISTTPSDETTTVLSSTEKYIVTVGPTMEKTKSNVNEDVHASFKEEFVGGNKKIFEGNIVAPMNTVRPSHSIVGTDLTSPTIDKTVTTTDKYVQTKLETEITTNKLMEVSPQNIDTATPFYENSFYETKKETIPPLIEVSITAMPPDETTVVLSSTEKYIATVKPAMGKTTLNNEVLDSLKEEFIGGNVKVIAGYTKSTNIVEANHDLNETGFASPETVIITSEYLHTTLKADASTNKLMKVSSEIEGTTTPVYEFSVPNPKENSNKSQVEFGTSTVPPDVTPTILSSTEKYTTTVKPNIEKTTSTVNNDVNVVFKDEITGGYEKEHITSSLNIVTSSLDIIKTAITSPTVDTTVTNSDNYIQTKTKTEISTNKLMEVSPKIGDTTTYLHDFSFSNPKEKNFPFQTEMSKLITPPDDMITVLSSTEKYIAINQPTLEKTTSNLNSEVLESLKEEFTGGNEIFFEGNIIPSKNTVRPSHSIIETGIVTPKIDKMSTSSDEYLDGSLKAESSTSKLMEVSPKIEDTTSPVYDFKFTNSKGKSISPQIEVGTPIIPPAETTTILSSNEKYTVTVKPKMEEPTFTLNNGVTESLKEEFTGGNEKFFGAHVTSLTNTVRSSSMKTDLKSPKIDETVATTDKFLHTKLKTESSTNKLMEVPPKIEHTTKPKYDFNISNLKETRVSPQTLVDTPMIQPEGTTIKPVMKKSSFHLNNDVSQGLMKKHMEKSTSKVNNYVLESFKEEFTTENAKVFGGNIPSTNIVTPSHGLSEIGLASPKIDETVNTSNEYIYTNLKTETSTNNLVEVSSKMEAITTRLDGLSFSNPKEKSIPPQTQGGISTISPDETATLLLSADKYITTAKPTVENPISNLSNDVSESLQEDFTGGNEKFFGEYVTPFTNTIDTIHGVTETAFSSTKIDETVTTINEYLFTNLKAETSTTKLMKVLPSILDTTTLVYDLSFSNPKEKSVSPLVGTLTTPPGETTAKLSPTEKYFPTVKPTTEKITSNFNNDVSDFAIPEIDETVITTNERLHTTFKTETSINNILKVSPKIADTTKSLYVLSFFDPKVEKVVGLPTILPDKTSTILQSTEKYFPMGKPTMETTIPNLTSNVAERLKGEFTLNSHTTPPQIKVGMSTIPSDKTTTILATEKYIPTVQPNMQKITYNLNEIISKSLKEELTGGNGKIFEKNIAPTTNTVTSSYSKIETGFARPKIDESVTTIGKNLLIKLKPETSNNKIIEDYPIIKDTITPLYDFSSSNSKEKSFSPEIEVGKSTIPSVETTRILFTTRKYTPTVKTTMKNLMSNMNNDALETLKEITGGNKKKIVTGLVSPKIDETVNSDEYLYTKTKIKNSTNQAEVSLKIDNFTTSFNDFGVSNVEGKSNAPQMTVYISTIAAGETTKKPLSTEKYLPTVKSTLKKTTSIFNSDILENSKEAVLGGREGIVSSSQSIMETNLVSPKTNENIPNIENPQTKTKSEISTVSGTPTTIFEDGVTSADELITVATQTQMPQFSLVQSFNLDKSDISLKNQLASDSLKSQHKTYSISPVLETVSEIPIVKLNLPEIRLATSTLSSNSDNLNYVNEGQTRLNSSLNVNLNSTSKLRNKPLTATTATQTINVSYTSTIPGNSKAKRAFTKGPLPITNGNVAEKTTNTVDCLKMPRGKYADSKDCRKFYICFGKCKPIVGICPNNTVFSEINKQCTRNLSHCVRNNQFHCLYEGRFSDYLKDNIYYICVKNNFGGFLRYKLQCQNGYHLNKITTKCENDLEMDKQSASFVSMSNSSNDRNESMVKSDLNENSENSDFECKKEGRFPFSKACRKYYVCTKNSKNKYRRRIKTCSSDEAFDKKKKKCVSAESNEC